MSSAMAMAYMPQYLNSGDPLETAKTTLTIVKDIREIPMNIVYQNK
jgi:hypothetical protein